MTARVTLPDRCLLYLLDRAGAGDAVAGELVQARVAEALAAQRAHVSRAMGKLARRGLVSEGKVRVQGETRRKVAYFLTDDGVRVARALRQRLEEGRVSVIDLEGRERSMRLFEVGRLLPRRPRFSDLLGAVDRGRLDLRDFVERQAGVHRGRLYDVRGAIAPPHFRGRADLFRRLDDFVGDPAARAFLLVGLPGIGKTAAASRWVKGRKGRSHILWRRIGVDTTATELLRDLAAVLHAAGRPALWEHLHRPLEAGLAPALRILTRDLASADALVVIDDAHLAAGDAADVLAAVLAAEGPPRMKALLIGRERPPFLRAEDVARGRVAGSVLDDLPPWDAEAILAALRVDPRRRPGILARCGGHPLALELAASGAEPPEAARRASVDWIAEAVLPRLGAEATEALAFAAIFGEAVPSAALGAAARRLVDDSLLRETGDGRVIVHDLVREAALRDVPRDRLADLHRRAAASLAETGEPRDALAAVRHLIVAGELRKAETVAAERGTDLIAAGLAGPLASLLESIVDEMSRPDVRLLRGHALFALGRWRDAARAYGSCTATGDPVTDAEALLGQGKAEHQRRSRLAGDLLERARDLLEGLGSLRLLAEAQYWIGCAHENAGRWEEARDAFERGRAIAFDVGDRRWEGLSAYGIGRIRSCRGDYRGAVAEERAALRLIERDGNRVEIAKVCTGLGGNLYELGRFREAEGVLGRAMEEARAAGAAGVLSIAVYNLGSLQWKAGRYEDAMRIYAEGMDLNEGLEQYDKAGECAAWHAACAARLGMRDVCEDGFRTAESLLARVRVPALRVKALRELADAERLSDRANDARRHFARAITEARAAGLVALVARLSAERKALT